MKINLTKNFGGIFTASSEEDQLKIDKLKTGCAYPFDVKKSRNPHFHGKVFAFLSFCFSHWCGDGTRMEHMDYSTQFDEFRKDLTIQAGYYNSVWNLSGTEFRFVAKSLSYGSMSQEEFEGFYSALINVAMKTIFTDCDNEATYNRLIAFF